MLFRSVCGIELLNANGQLRTEDGAKLIVVNEIDGKLQEVPL